MSNTLLTNDIILKTALMEFENNLVFAKTVRRDYQNDFNATTGDTIRIRKPTRFTAREGATLNVQDIEQQNTVLTIAHQDGVDVAITSKELALELDDFNREVIQPAMVTLGNQVDSRLFATSTDIYNAVGTAGTAPNSFAVINNASALLNSLGVTQDSNRFALLKSFDAASVQNALYNTFNENFNKEILLRGSMGNLAGFDFYSVQNAIRPSFSSLPNVAALGAPEVNGMDQSGTSLITDGFTPNVTGILKKGAVFTIQEVNSVNPTSRNDTGQLAQFVVTQDVNSDANGNVIIPISPAITLTGPYQTVTKLPSDNDSLTFVDTHTINIAYHREAFTLAMIRLPQGDNGAYQKSMVDDKANISLRMTRQYNITSDQDIIRFDILYGVKCFPEYATRVLGS